MTLSECLDYRVSHSIYGDIGTYSNAIERDGQTTMVTSTPPHSTVPTTGRPCARDAFSNS